MVVHTGWKFAMAFHGRFSDAHRLPRPAILTARAGRNHERRRARAFSRSRPFVFSLLAACSSSPPSIDALPDTAPPPLHPPSHNTYFEGSQRVWDAARERGVTFRAVGQEPGWVLEIEGDDRITLTTNYGADRVVVPAPSARTDPVARTTTYHAVTENADLHISIHEEPCTDTMSGERFPASAVVVLNGTVFHGCGRS
ncbi:MAG: COG3650 family protein [Longimicrobiales bacterium]